MMEVQEVQEQQQLLENREKLFSRIEFSYGGQMKASSGKRVSPLPPPLLINNQWEQITPVGNGIRNYGNSCFMNSALQILVYTPPLNNAILLSYAKHKQACNNRICHLCLFVQFLQSCRGARRVVSPNQIYQNIKSISKQFRVGRQEDSHEFLRMYLDSLHVQLEVQQKATKSRGYFDIKAQSLIGQIFGGQMSSRVVCKSCHYVSATQEFFQDISLDIHNCDTIQKSLDIFFKKDELSGQNKYRCDNCKNKVDATKQFLINETPNVFTLHLKRFNNYLMKINRNIRYSENIDISKYVHKDPKKEQQTKYKLYGVLVHQGTHITSGHYYCYVQNSNKMWYMMNDEQVKMCKLEQVLNQSAYILFYVRQDPIKQQPKQNGNSQQQNPQNNSNGHQKIDKLQQQKNLQNARNQIDDLFHKVSKQNGPLNNLKDKKQEQKIEKDNGVQQNGEQKVEQNGHPQKQKQIELEQIDVKQNKQNIQQKEIKQENKLIEVKQEKKPEEIKQEKKQIEVKQEKKSENVKQEQQIEIKQNVESKSSNQVKQREQIKGVQKNSIFSLLQKNKNNQETEIFDQLPVKTTIQSNHLKRNRLLLMKDMQQMTIKKIKIEAPQLQMNDIIIQIKKHCPADIKEEKQIIKEEKLEIKEEKRPIIQEKKPIIKEEKKIIQEKKPIIKEVKEVIQPKIAHLNGDKQLNQIKSIDELFNYNTKQDIHSWNFSKDLQKTKLIREQIIQNDQKEFGTQKRVKDAYDKDYDKGKLKKIKKKKAHKQNNFNKAEDQVREKYKPKYD